MNVIIIDDEQHARDNLKRRLLKIDPQINVLDMVSCASDAYSSILNYGPDLIFLDIEMPGGDGFSLLDKIDIINFDVIFVTAYSEFALKAFEKMAIGYITKPIDSDLLSKVYCKSRDNQSRLINRVMLEELSNKIESLSKSSKVSIPTEKGVDLVLSSSIVMLQTSDGYTSIHLDDGNKMISSKRLKYFEDRLESNFKRMHRSIIINTEYIKKYYKAGFVTLMDGQELPVGRKYKNNIEGIIRE